MIRRWTKICVICQTNYNKLHHSKRKVKEANNPPKLLSHLKQNHPVHENPNKNTEKENKNRLTVRWICWEGNWKSWFYVGWRVSEIRVSFYFSTKQGHSQRLVEVYLKDADKSLKRLPLKKFLKINDKKIISDNKILNSYKSICIGQK